jgi:hypothetical protein
MKSKLISIIFTAALLSLAESGFPQGFTNLNFESATIVQTGGSSVQFNQAFPGWTGTVGGVQQTLALYNDVYLDTAGIAIIDHNWTNSAAYNNGGGYPPISGLIQGNYTAILMSGNTSGANPQPADTTLSQTSLVPIGIQSLQFKAYEAFDSLGSFAVTLGGQTLSLTTLGTGADYTLYGANVSQWAGQTAQLAFTAFGENPHVDDEYLYLDSIQFSTQSVPEPSAFALAALGALFLGFDRRKRRLR